MEKNVTLKQKTLNPGQIRKKVNRSLNALVEGLINLSKENKFYDKIPFQNKLLAYNSYLNLAEENGLSKEKYQNYFANNF